jgi:hypothetical protein
VKLVRLRRPKITCSPLYADYRPKTNAVILLDMGHMHTGGIGKGKETQNLKVFDVPAVEEQIQ